LKKILGTLFRFTARVTLVTVVLPVLYLIDPAYRLRFGTMYTQQFGQLATNADIFLRAMQLTGQPRRSFYMFFGWAPANRQLMEMWKRMRGYPARFMESEWGARLMFAWKPIMRMTRFWEACQDTSTEYYLYTHTDPVLSFTPEEEAKGKALLAEMGIDADDWFVCFHARDGVYFRNWRPQFEESWSKIDFRNIDITRFMKTAEYIASLGGYAIRFGADVGQPLPDTDNPRIIDYSSEYRSDFMDVYLTAKCRFFIGCCSGPTSVASAFNTPVLSVNHHPYNLAHFRHCDIFVPRLLIDPKNGRRASFWEAQRRGYFVGGRSGSSLHPTMDMYEMLETDEDDILDACKDMVEALENRGPTVEAAALQDFYAEYYLKDYDGYEFAAKVGARYVVKYRDLIVPPGDAGKPVAATATAEGR
jgi:putative glycosyltransferase (TIGR04372 family)